MNSSPLVILAIVGSAVVTAVSLLLHHRATKILHEDAEARHAKTLELMMEFKKKNLIERVDWLEDAEDYSNLETVMETFISEQELYLDEVTCAQNIVDLEMALLTKEHLKGK